jgi:hypothetical protein
VRSWAAAMVMLVEEWSGMMMVVGNYMRVSDTCSELVVHAQTQ